MKINNNQNQIGMKITIEIETTDRHSINEAEELVENLLRKNKVEEAEFNREFAYWAESFFNKKNEESLYDKWVSLEFIREEFNQHFDLLKWTPLKLRKELHKWASRSGYNFDLDSSSSVRRITVTKNKLPIPRQGKNQ